MCPDRTFSARGSTRNHCASAMATPSDPTVRDQFLRGDPAGPGQVRSWIQGIVRFGAWGFPDPEGVVQEILLKLVEIGRADRFRGISDFQRFVRAVARNTCIDLYRRERLRRRYEREHAVDEPPISGDHPEKELMSVERLHVFRIVFRTLPEDCRRLFRWMYSERLSAAEMGGRLGITANNARVRMHRCLERARGLAREQMSRRKNRLGPTEG